MQKTFTLEFMLANRGCYSVEYLMNCSFMNNESVLLLDIVYSEIPIRDKYWFFCFRIASIGQSKQIGIIIADLTLPLFESRYPGNMLIRECVEACRLYIGGVISFEKLKSIRETSFNVYGKYVAHAFQLIAHHVCNIAGADTKADVFYVYDLLVAAAVITSHVDLRNILIEFINNN